MSWYCSVISLGLSRPPLSKRYHLFPGVNEPIEIGVVKMTVLAMAGC